MRYKFLTLMATAALAAVSQLMAGGFYLESGNPQANQEAQKANAVLIVRAVGCHNPADAQVTGTAIGVVDGERRSIPLKLTKLSTPGAYAIAAQWPAQGRWALEFIGRNDGAVTSTVIPAAGHEVQRTAAKQYPRQPSTTEVASAIEGAAR